jgi:hypothetical protein
MDLGRAIRCNVTNYRWNTPLAREFAFWRLYVCDGEEYSSPWGLDLSDVTYVTAEVHNEIYRRSPVEQGDVLYIKDGATTGLAAVNYLE